MFDIWTAVQSVIGGPASQNLYAYLSQATLRPMKLARSAPPLPPRGHKSHLNKLSIMMRNYRTLETIHKIRNEVFSGDALDCEYAIIVSGPNIFSEPSSLAGSLGRACIFSSYTCIGHR